MVACLVATSVKVFPGFAVLTLTAVADRLRRRDRLVRRGVGTASGPPGPHVSVMNCSA